MKGNYYLGNREFEMGPIKEEMLGEYEVLVSVAACGVCGTDVHIYFGDKGSAEVVPPVILGHEFSGTVEKIGAKVRKVKIGDHVSIDPNIYCGECHYCRMGKKQLCTNLLAIGINRNGGFADYCYVPEAQCYLLNKNVPVDFGALAEPLACCIHGIDRANIHIGSTVLVVGGGTIGLLMVQLARLSGASIVILSEPVELRREIGIKVGANFAVDPINELLNERIEEITGVPGVDVVIECVGNTVATAQAFGAAKRGTTILLFSVPKSGASHPLKLEQVFQQELTITSSLINPDTHQRAADLINQGIIQIKPIITHRYPIERLKDAILMQMSNESLKVLVGDG